MALKSRKCLILISLTLEKVTWGDSPIECTVYMDLVQCLLMLKTIGAEYYPWIGKIFCLG